MNAFRVMGVIRIHRDNGICRFCPIGCLPKTPKHRKSQTLVSVITKKNDRTFLLKGFGYTVRLVSAAIINNDHAIILVGKLTQNGLEQLG